MNSIRVLLSVTTNLDWPMHQFDVKNVFLHGDLEEEVYIEVLVGLEDPSSMSKVCKLKKALYDLKQSIGLSGFLELCRDLVTKKVKLVIHFLLNIPLKEM